MRGVLATISPHREVRLSRRDERTVGFASFGRLTASFQRAWNDCQAIKNPVNDWAQGLYEAERVGFEPTVGLHPRWFSRPEP